MVSGGLEYSGVPIAAISETEIRGCVQEILKLDPPVRNLVISGVFSPRDDPLEGQEVQAARIVRAACPDISCTLSHGVRTRAGALPLSRPEENMLSIIIILGLGQAKLIVSLLITLVINAWGG